MAERAIDRVTRMLGIVSYLESNGDTSFETLAAQFGVSNDDIQRDVATLWVSGLPGYMPDDLIDFDGDLFDQGIARLTAGQGVRQVRLSAREAVALIGALSSFLASGAAPAAAQSAVRTLQSALGGESVRASAPAELPAQVVDALTKAVVSQKVATLEYVDAKDQLTTRVVEPHRMVSIGDVAYLECYCRRAQDYRTLRIDRIRSASVGTDTVTTPPSDAGGFSLEPAFEATIVLARGARRAVEDLPGVTIEAAQDDVIATFGVADADYVASRLLAIAPYLRSVEPAQLRDTLAARARAVLEARA